MTALGAPHLEYEREAGGPVAGVDEAGRGPLAGPVVAAAVLIADPWAAVLPEGVADSKTLDAEEREALFEIVCGSVPAAVGIASVAEIDRLNILAASMLAMRRAVLGLPRVPVLVLVDGNRVPELPCPARAVVNGDALCASVAAASIVAKVVRDRIMAALAAAHPEFGWEHNRGYATPDHRRAIAEAGITCHHRRTFGTVRALLAPELPLTITP